MSMSAITIGLVSRYIPTMETVPLLASRSWELSNSFRLWLAHHSNLQLLAPESERESCANQVLPHRRKRIRTPSIR